MSAVTLAIALGELMYYMGLHYDWSKEPDRRIFPLILLLNEGLCGKVILLA